MASFLAIISTSQGEELSGKFLILVNGLLPEYFARSLGNINFFQVGSIRDCIDGPKAETRRHSGERFLTGF